jgi:hypothetical protein
MSELKRRGPGRPRLDDNDPSVQINLTVTSKMFDALCAVASRHDLSMSEVIRRCLRARERARGLALEAKAAEK